MKNTKLALLYLYYYDKSGAILPDGIQLLRQITFSLVFLNGFICPS